MLSQSNFIEEPILGPNIELFKDISSKDKAFFNNQEVHSPEILKTTNEDKLTPSRPSSLQISVLIELDTQTRKKLSIDR